MNYFHTLMQAEREFRQLQKIKLGHSKNPRLSQTDRNKLFYEHLKCKKEADSYKAEIEMLAENSFPLPLELTIHEILNSQAI